MVLAGGELEWGQILDCPDGSEIQAALSARPAEGAQPGVDIDLEARVTRVGRADGLAQRLVWQRPGLRSADALLPGVWYKQNAHVEDCGAGIAAAPSLQVREDRVTWPSVALFGGGGALRWTRRVPADTDAEPVGHDDTSLLYEGPLLYDRATGRSDIAAVGFDLAAAGGPTLGMHHPFVESPYSAQLRIYPVKGVEFFDHYCRASSVAGFLAPEMLRHRPLRSSWRLTYAPEADFGAVMSAAWREAFELYKPPPRAALPPIDEIRRAMANFVASRFERSATLSGFTYLTSVPSGVPLLPFIEPGFTGRAFLNARHLLAEGRRFENPGWVAMAEAVFDGWIAGGQVGGVFYDLWDIAADRPASDSELGAAPTSFAIRREAEALWALLQAVADEAAGGVTREVWRETARAHADRLLELTQSDDGYCRRYTFEGRCLDGNRGGSSSVVAPLVAAWRMFGDDRYLDQAVRTTRLVVEQFVIPADYYASTIDNASENKEAATYAFYAARLICEIRCPLGEPQWRVAAQAAAGAALTWIQMVDVPFQANSDRILARLRPATRGLGNIAAGGGNLDPYAFEFPGSLIWLADVTGDQRYAEMAAVILSAVLDVVAVPGRMHGLAVEGMVPEGLQKTMFAYIGGGKGTYAPFSALGWTTASVWMALDEVERVSGQGAEEWLAGYGSAPAMGPGRRELVAGGGT